MDQAEQLRNVIKLNPAPRPLARVITVTSGKVALVNQIQPLILHVNSESWVRESLFLTLILDLLILRLCLVQFLNTIYVI